MSATVSAKRFKPAPVERYEYRYTHRAAGKVERRKFQTEESFLRGLAHLRATKPSNERPRLDRRRVGKWVKQTGPALKDAEYRITFHDRHTGKTQQRSIHGARLDETVAHVQRNLGDITNISQRRVFGGWEQIELVEP